MVTRELPMERHYIPPVCNMALISLHNIEEFLIFLKIFAFKCVYAHIRNLNYEKN